MTTYSFSSGVAVFRDTANDKLLGVDASGNSLEVVVADAVTTLSYSVNALGPGDEPGDQTVDIALTEQQLRLNGSTSALDTAIYSLFTVDWTDDTSTARTTTVLVANLASFSAPPHGVVDADFIFTIDGDPLPVLNTKAAWRAFDTAITGIAIPTGPLGPGQPIALTDFFPAVTQADLFVATPGDDRFAGGIGKDTLRGGDGDDILSGGDGADKLFGGNGSDQLLGGNGNDRINTGENGPGSFDHVEAGSGRDRVIMSDILQGFGQLGHFDLDKRIVANVDGDANTAFINKGTNGRTTVVDVQNPLHGDGFGIIGTGFDDIFNISPGTGGWMQVRGRGGNDTYNIGASEGFVRLDFRDSSAQTGVDIHLGQGVVSNDGFGGTDTITGTGIVNEVRGTSLGDMITGSGADERFILESGSDRLNGAGGVDTVRYDRPGVTAVTVDLSARIANGVWGGVTFEHVLVNMENVTGSLTDDDKITGNGAENRLEGNGGDDQLSGLAGSDILIGGVGDDVLNGGRGGDVLDGGVGTDTASYIGASGSVRADLANAGRNSGDAAGDTYSSVENLTGSANRDRLSGDGGRNEIAGGNRNDRLEGRAGHDVLIGGRGNDRLDGGAGNDRLIGQKGSDTFVFGAGKDTIVGFEGDRLLLDDALWGNATLTPAQILDFASVVAGDLVFDFGSGQTLTLENFTDANALQPLIDVF